MEFKELYLIEILHQTTTEGETVWGTIGCILLKFYIKPQHWVPQCIYLLRCILLKFYIKPQRLLRFSFRVSVVSY